MARMKPPMVPDKPIPVVPEDALRRLLAVCAGKSFEARRDTAMIVFLIDTGARRGEIADLRVTDLDFDLDIALVLGKGRRERPTVRPHYGGRARPLPPRPRSTQGRRSPVAVAGALWSSDRLGAGADVAAPQPPGRPTGAAPASVPSHLRPPVAGSGWGRDRPDALSRLEVSRDAPALWGIGGRRPGPRGPPPPVSRRPALRREWHDR
jgi:hypothetical protein